MQGKYTPIGDRPIVKVPVKPMPAPVPVAKAVNSVDELPASVMELGGLLKKAPAIRIVINDQRLGIEGPRGYQYWEVVGNISKLVYFDQECFAHLHGLGVEMVSGENFFYKAV